MRWIKLKTTRAINEMIYVLMQLNEYIHSIILFEQADTVKFVADAKQCNEMIVMHITFI